MRRDLREMNKSVFVAHCIKKDSSLLLLPRTRGCMVYFIVMLSPAWTVAPEAGETILMN